MQKSISVPDKRIGGQKAVGLVLKKIEAWWVSVAALLLLVLALLLVLWSWLFYPMQAARTPTFDDWSVAASFVKERFKQGDFVAVVPFWASMGEKAFAENKLPHRYVRWVSREDWPVAKRLWVVSGYDRFIDREEWLARGAVTVENYKVGSLDIELFTLPCASGPVYDFHDHLHEAEVFTRRGYDEVSCGRWDEKEERFHCTRRNDWHYVGRIIQEIGDGVRPSIWAHPVTAKELHVSFKDVPGGKRIVVFHGLNPYAAAAKDGKPVFIDVYIGKKKLGRAVQENVGGWHKSEFRLEGVSADRNDIDIVITTPRDGRRHFSFNGYVE